MKSDNTPSQTTIAPGETIELSTRQIVECEPRAAFARMAAIARAAIAKATATP